MSNKMITLMQGDYGIVINTQIKDEKGEPIYIQLSDTIYTHVQFPDGNCEDIDDDNLTIIDRKKGIVRIVLSEKYTEQEGFYQIFIAIGNEGYKLTAKKSIQYYVNPKHQIGSH